MEVSCSPYNSVLFFGAAVLFIFCTPSVSAQCKADFTYQTVSSEKDLQSGKIEVFLTSQPPGSYNFKLFQMDGTVKMVQSKEAISPDKVTFEGLKPATYFVRVDWPDSCSKTLGGFEGITITEKDQ